jgi:hypothetical protein
VSDERKERGDSEDVHRLRDIVVEEVSLVDRAANKRRFLVVKRSSEMPDDTTAGDQLDTDDTGSTDGDVEKAKRKPVDEDEDDVEKKRTKAQASEDDEEEEDEDDEAEKAADEDDEEEEDGEDEKRSARQRKQEGSMPPKEAVLRALTEALQRLMSLASSLKEALASGEDGGEPPSPEVVREVEAIAGLLGKLAESYASPKRKAAVAKAGARMARSRLDRFQKAIELLSSILKELTNAKEPPRATAGGAETVGKRDTRAAPAGVTELASEIRELTRVVKRQEEELSKMRQTRGVSNAIPVDGGRRTEPQEVSWPFDMNRPITRDRVRKEVSFFDD